MEGTKRKAGTKTDEKIIISKSQSPHTCPVCVGKGIVPNGFYLFTNRGYTTSSMTPETCRSCIGSGIVWS